MRRWTDGKRWSSSRVHGRFLAYREMEREARQRIIPQDEYSTCRFKVNGLIKQSFSITATTGQRLHLISYHSQNLAGGLQIPSSDPTLQSVCPQKCFFPKSLVNDLQNFPVFAREHAKTARSKPHSEPLMMHYAHSSQPVNIKGTSYPHDRFQSVNPPREHSPDLPSPEGRTMDPLDWCATPDVTAPTASPTLQTKSPQISASESVYQRSHRELLPTHSKAILLSHILS